MFLVFRSDARELIYRKGPGLHHCLALLAIFSIPRAMVALFCGSAVNAQALKLCISPHYYPSYIYRYAKLVNNLLKTQGDNKLPKNSQCQLRRFMLYSRLGKLSLNL